MVENLIVELSIVELSTIDEKILEHCLTVELSMDELSEIDEFPEIVEALSIVELSIVYALLLKEQLSAITTDESPLSDDVSASLDVLVSPVESSDEDDPPPPAPPPPHEIIRKLKINIIRKKIKFFIILLYLREIDSCQSYSFHRLF